MAKFGLSALDADILRTTFKKAVLEESIPESGWRKYAEELIQIYTGSQTVDPRLVDWMVSK
ncbi:hypothetical protein C7I87_32495 [Mesorhizobium sp. SARCC-RB16n]|nr:hypothetical protein C7I87_32495 [Mesorhizobium sp. SARCC-RB16n]